jgi:membrane protein YqaA with SNARE-associated domain
VKYTLRKLNYFTGFGNICGSNINWVLGHKRQRWLSAYYEHSNEKSGFIEGMQVRDN